MQPFARPPIGLLAAAVRRAIKTAVLRRVEPLGLSSAQFWILVGIAEAPGASQCELAARLRIDEPTASRTLRSLRARGWVRAIREKADRRRVRLELTDAGEALARRLRPIARSLRNAVEAPLTDREREQTRAALAKIVDHLQRVAAEPRPRISP
jgi:DNA-binding MarR family transcriptional regulator